MNKPQVSKVAVSKHSNMTHCQVGPRPKSDDGYFEQMTKAVFRSGFNWTVIGNKWPGFRKAFANFSIQDVARFNEPDIDRLMQDKGIVRNYRKVLATIENARELLKVQQAHGSFGNYLKEMGQNGEEELCKALGKRFSHLGNSTSVVFLRAVGEEMPEMSRRWMEKRSPFPA